MSQTLPRRAALALAALLVALPAWAHRGGAPGGLRWTFDAWVTVPLVLSLAWFLLGHRTLRARSRQPRARRTSLAWFVTGWTVLAAALVTPLHAAGERSFAAHMLEHELLMLVAAPLLVMARPVGVALWALPRTARASLVALGRSRIVGALWRGSTAPLFATLAQAVVLWGWHAPAAFDLALASPGWHIAQHACFLASALLFWWAMLQGRGRYRTGLAVACLFVTSLVSGALGALMAFSSGPWYAGYARLGLDAFGLSAIEDQQLAGLLMWVPGGLIHAAVGVALLARVLRLDQSRGRPAQARITTGPPFSSARW